MDLHSGTNVEQNVKRLIKFKETFIQAISSSNSMQISSQRTGFPIKWVSRLVQLVFRAKPIKFLHIYFGEKVQRPTLGISNLVLVKEFK